jgi:hypothetical protein
VDGVAAAVHGVVFVWELSEFTVSGFAAAVEEEGCANG